MNETAKEYLDAMGDDFKKVIASLDREFNSVRTGRASPALLDSVTVTVASYGATMPINQLGSVSTPDARLLVVNPWDKGTIGDIEKAIMSAGLGLNPSNDGQVVRIPIPPLTGERRQELVKTVKRMTEDARIRARSVRKDYNDTFKDLEKDKEISEDELKRLLDMVQSATNDTIKALDSAAAEKEQEVLEV